MAIGMNYSQARFSSVEVDSGMESVRYPITIVIKVMITRAERY